jgi:hypothetical protein
LGEEECVIGVEQWAEIRRLYFVERRSKRAIHRLTGVHRDTITRALASDQPPKYVRAPTGSKLDPFRDWICEQLGADASIPSLRLREMATELGYELCSALRAFARSQPLTPPPMLYQPPGVATFNRRGWSSFRVLLKRRG